MGQYPGEKIPLLQKCYSLLEKAHPKRHLKKRQRPNIRESPKTVGQKQEIGEVDKILKLWDQKVPDGHG